MQKEKFKKSGRNLKIRPRYKKQNERIETRIITWIIKEKSKQKREIKVHTIKRYKSIIKKGEIKVQIEKG